jgi:hypothetical protein
VVPERQVLGATLAVVGAMVLAGFLVPDLQRWTLVLVSATLLVAFALTREYGFGIAAGITGGMGVGILILTGALAVGAVTPATGPGWLLLSVGGGFATGWLLGWLAVPQERNPWPLVPGLLIGSIGWVLAAGRPDLISTIQVVAAGLLIVAGAAALFGGERARS